MTVDPPPTPPSELALPERIGAYRVVRKIGEGGMGAVYEAEQENPRRRVALKVLARGVLSGQLVRRFELEAQVLGRLHHPGIAQIFEAGQFEVEGARLPFFAMEYIEGETLLRYAAQHDLSIDARVELVARICDAVHHAHLRGIVHRDLKPGNILVDASGQPKVLDFGIARATDADVRTTTLQTEVGQIIGTLPYMSPEQAMGDPSRIDARSDVYSLGVVAYQLVSGHLPYDLEGVFLHEAVRVVREVEPRPLSTVIRQLRGDVETIVGKALEKDPDRRYASVAALGDDLRRYLAHEPILARPPSALYQIVKFARRNKALVVGGAAVIVALVVGLVGTSLGYVEAKARAEDARVAEGKANSKAEEARLNAERARRNEEEADRSAAQARAEAARANQTKDFLVDLLEGIRPDVAQGLDTRLMRLVLDGTAARIERQLAGLPAVEAEMRGVLGSVYQAIGESAPAYEQYLESLRIQRELLGDTHPDVLAQRVSELNVLAALDGGRSTAGFEELYEEARRELDPEHPVVDQIRGALGVRYLQAFRMEEAEPLLSASLAWRRAALGTDHELTLIMVNSLGLLRMNQRRFDEAENLLRGAHDTYLASGGEAHPETIRLRHNLAGLYNKMQRPDVAEEMYREAIAGARGVFGEEHPLTLRMQHNLAQLLVDRELRDSGALELIEEVVGACRRVLGPDHEDTRKSETLLATVLTKEERWEEAAALRERLYTDALRREGPDAHATRIAKGHYATALESRGRPDEALALRLELLEEMDRHEAPDHPDALTLANDLGLAYMKRAEWETATRFFERAEQGRRAVLGDRHGDTLFSVYCSGLVHRRQEQWTEAVAPQAEFLEGWAELNGDDHPWCVEAARYTLICAELSDPLAPLEHEVRAVEAYYRRVGKITPRFARAVGLLAECLVELGHEDEALPMFEKVARALEAMSDTIEAKRDADPSYVFRAHAALGMSLARLGDFEGAEPYLLEAWKGLPEAHAAHRRRIARHLAIAYEGSGNAGAAEEWRERAGM